MAGPLDGVRVLDLTTMVAGPVATMMLADQGADVIKVESPNGDLMRHFSRGRNGMSASFLSCNRNKRSLAVDLKSAEGLEIVQQADRDRAGVRSQLSSRRRRAHRAWRRCRARHSAAISSMCRSADLASKGPYAGQRAYDPVIQALSGLADIQRDRDTGRPRMVRTIIADYTTALTAAQAITAALFARERTGRRAACADRDARRDDCLPVAGSDAEPDLRRRRDAIPRMASWDPTSSSRRKIATSPRPRCRMMNGRGCAARSTARISSMIRASRPHAIDRSTRSSGARSPPPNWRNGPPTKSCRACSPTTFPRRRC